MTSGDAVDKSRVWAPDQGDSFADERNAAADERDVVASARDALADAREARLDAWERQLEARANRWWPAVDEAGERERGEATQRRLAERRDTLLAAAFAGIAENLHEAATAEALLTRIAEAALTTILGATTATVTSGGPDTGQSEEPGVPGEEVATSNAGSAMSFPFQTFTGTEGSTASLHVYAATPGALDRTAQEIGFILAAHASLAARELGERIRLEAVGRQLEQALSSRDVIGQAKGILMERLKTTPEDAFGILKNASQRLNVKLREVASTLTETGEVDSRDVSLP